ncbi:MAG: phosphohistidine phosphatase SixA [candidate division Zixibacteria bacterium]|nr:phosphohistidine phosphatase SixA [candidate division Zixibacteria bacterium]
MLLYLVQHAYAKSKDEDPERPLTDEGFEIAERMASYADKHLCIDIEKIIHSGKLRAMQTADLFGDYLNPPMGVEQAEGLNPGDDPRIWLEKLTKGGDNVMLVGHLPHLSKLATLLLCGFEGTDKISFTNAGVVCLESDESGFWHLNWMVTPSIICECDPKSGCCCG